VSVAGANASTRSHLPVSQLPGRPGIIDLGPGTVPRRALPGRELVDALAIALDESPVDAVGYGANQGPGPLLSWLAGWLPTLYDGAPTTAEILVTAGATSGLDRICTALTRPGDVALCQSPTYHLAAGHLQSRGLRLVPVADDGRGPTGEVLEAALARRPPSSQQPHCIYYLVPVHSNPTGVTVGIDRWECLVRRAREREVTLVCDDVYVPIDFRGVDAPRMPLDTVRDPLIVRLGSFSKIVAPGLRVGWLVADRALVQQLASDGLTQSGGGPSHTAAMIVHALCQSTGWEARLRWLVRRFAEQRDALTDALADALPPGLTYDRPQGGFFIWLRALDDTDLAAALPVAERHGVSYVPGTAFVLGDQAAGRRSARIAFSGHEPDTLREAARRLGDALQRARVIA
jgi:DNA-binding transcriptional MocR family regulator